MSDTVTERLAEVLNAHHPTRGMSVSMGVTCECGYWTGSEPDAGKRPLPWGRDQLDLHRATALAPVVDELVAEAKVEAWREGHAVGAHDVVNRQLWNHPPTPNPYDITRAGGAS